MGILNIHGIGFRQAGQNDRRGLNNDMPRGNR
jgi:hypothetical protein